LPELYAFLGDRLAGVFHSSSGETAVFEPAHEVSRTPVSLSLPTDRITSGRAPYAYLDGLLPDDDAVRARWARERGLSDDIFALLGEYGQDVAGAVTLSASADLSLEPEVLFEATEDDIAARIAAIRSESTSWLDPRARPRMSLGGQQGKFSLARVGDRWYWPTRSVPSTHVFKPPSPRHKLVDVFESACLDLARQAGLPAAQSAATNVLGQPVFVTERWDRLDGARIHAEDLAQALGRPTVEKYEITAPEAAKLLARFGQERPFVKQLAFNVAIGNFDAHAKNYSVLLAGNQVALSPLYDTVPIVMYGNMYDTRLAMKVGRAQRPAEVGYPAWAGFAKSSGLDPDLVWEEASTVMAWVAERFYDHMSALSLDSARLSFAQKQVRSITKALKPKSTANK
jgi:serine/threonine-protein kinase HipA